MCAARAPTPWSAVVAGKKPVEFDEDAAILALGAAASKPLAKAKVHAGIKRGGASSSAARGGPGGGGGMHIQSMPRTTMPLSRKRLQEVIEETLDVLSLPDRSYTVAATGRRVSLPSTADCTRLSHLCTGMFSKCAAAGWGFRADVGGQVARMPAPVAEVAADRLCVHVVNGDTITVSLRLAHAGMKYADVVLELVQTIPFAFLRRPAALLMASAKRPGGGYLTGAAAQEETMFRRTTLHENMADNPNIKYRLLGDKAVYVPAALVFRGEDYAFTAPEPLAFVGMPALVNPKVQPSPADQQINLQNVFCCVSIIAARARQQAEQARRGGDCAPHASHFKGVCVTTRYLCPPLLANQGRLLPHAQAAHAHGHDSVVLGAMGCGAFRNPPAHVAQLFHTVLQEQARLGVAFRVVAFAIIEDHNSDAGGGNLRPFAAEFRVPVLSVPEFEAALAAPAAGAGAAPL